MDLQEFRRRFAELKSKGFVPTTREGSTGVGHTLESALSLAENNIALPDIDQVELKAHREGASNPVTLFTFNREAWMMPPLDAIREYGSYDTGGRLGMYYTMSLTPNSAGLFLTVNAESITVEHTSGETVLTWRLTDLAERFIQKMPALLLVSARVEERDGKEHFHFHRAQLMKGTTPEQLGDLFQEEVILVDLRLHDQGTSARNHGTGFRVYENNLPRLFKEIIDL